MLSQHVYNIQLLQKGPTNIADWRIKSAYIEGGYVGALYFNSKIQQAILTHQGTNNFSDIIEDFQGIYRNQISTQKQKIFTIIDEAIAFSQEMEFQLSFTGHSLGAFLAELSVYYCHRSFDFNEVSAVTFESPDCRETLESLQLNQASSCINLENLDIVSFLSYPNLINTCNRHFGTLYSLEPNLGEYGWISAWHLKQAHSMDNIVALLSRVASSHH